MKQSNNNKKSRDVTAFLYERLSRDDNMDGESYSIGNQKKLLIKVAKEKGYTNLVHFFDDGISGVTMDRPGFADMIQQLEQGKAAAVFVKDLSRLGRNYIEVGRLTEEFFPNHDIRLVAVSDNIDTDEGENELAPIRNLFNEWYARDISKKRRISNKIKGNAGEPMGQPPYGYIKDPENPKRWIVDEEAAQVVRRIYRMTLEGVGTEQIAAKLEEDGILTPRAYWHSKGINRPGKVKDLLPTHWNSSSVIKMLSVQEYCGDILNFKTYSKSYKNKKRLENDRENWAIFKDVHEPIIERAVFEQVQQKRGKMRKRQAKDGERSMFSGLLVCADCGSNLHFHFNQGNPEIKYFNCSNYKGNRGTCGSTHYVRVDFLEQVVLGEIRRLTKYAGLYEDDFLKEVIGHSRQAEETERRLKEKELKSLLARDDELDGLFERIYEDNVSGKLSDDRFAKMSRRYEEEQKELSEKIKKLRSEIEKQNSRATSTDMFVSIVRKYTRARKLTPRMLNELVEKIEVYNAEKIDGEWVQRLRIHYNCVGEMNIPNEPALPIPAVTVNTRKGVFVSYTTDDSPCCLSSKKSECPHSFSNAVRTLAMVPVVGLSAQIVLCLHSVLRARTAFAPRPGKTLHRTVLFPRLRVPFDLTKTQRHPTGASVFGAGGGTLRSNRPLLALRAARSDCFRSPAGQNAPQDRFVSPASSPVRLNQTQRHPTGASVFGAGGGTRTHTVLLPTDFESVTSANSITPANMFKFCTYISLTHFLNGFKRENHIILKI